MRTTTSFLFALFFSFFQPRANATEPQDQKLDLRFMNLKTIEFDSAKASALLELDVSGNPVKTLPEAVKYAKDLKILRLNYCSKLDLGALGRLIKNLPIEELEINNCNLLYLPYDIAEIRTLKKLSLKNNLLQELPWNLFYNAELEYLNVEENELDEIHPDLVKLHKLTYLGLGGNPLLGKNKWWEELRGMSSLKTLECSKALKLPKEWTMPVALEELVLNDCRANFPEKLIGCTNLKKMELRNSPANTEDILKAPDARNLMHLTLTGNNVTKIQDIIGEYKKLESLELDVAKLSEVSEKISALQSLSKVKVRVDDTISLAKFLKALANTPVEELDLSNNNFNVLPGEIQYVRNVKKLNLQNIGMRSCGEDIYKLQRITELDMRGNSIDTKELEKTVKAFPSAQLYYDQVNPTVKNTGYINRPFSSIPAAPEKFFVNTTKDTVITTGNGTKITLPANAMVDRNGKPIKGKVQVSFETYYDPIEIFASGIPMTADSAGKKKNFASAGMFSLNATTADNKAAYLKKGKKVNVDFVSKSPGKSYNYYYLDTVKKNWVQTGKDNVQEDAFVKRKYSKKYPKMPANPYNIRYTRVTIDFPNVNLKKKKYKKSKETYFSLRRSNYYNWNKDSLNYDPVELAVYEDYDYWMLVEKPDSLFKKISGANNKGIFGSNPESIKKNFSTTTGEGVEVTIRANKVKDCYDIIFYSLRDSLVIEAIPAMLANDPQKQQKESKKKYDEYMAKYNQNTTRRSGRTEKFRKAYEEYRKEMQKYDVLMKAYTDRSVSAEEYQKLLQNENKEQIDNLNTQTASIENITRSLELTGFGTYNCDYFSRINNPIVCSPNFINKENKRKISVEKVTLIDIDENAYVSASTSQLKLAPNRNYWIFTQTADNKIGFSVICATKRTVGDIAVKMVNATSIQELRSQLMY